MTTETAGTSGGTIRRVKKTTVYLPDDLKARIERVAERDGISEAEVIRRSLEASVGDALPRPRWGLFRSGAPIADRADEFLDGFGDN